MRSWVPQAVLRTALALAGLSTAYLLALVMIFEVRIGNEAEAVGLGLLWIAGAVAAAGLGHVHSRRGPAQRAWLLVPLLAVMTLPLAVTPLLGTDPPAVLATLAFWGGALSAIALAVTALLRAGRVRAGTAAAVLGGLVLVVAVPFVSARLHLPAGEASLASAPWWLPVSITDHAPVGPDVVGRLDALEVASGVSVFLMLCTAYALAYVVRSAGTRSARTTAH